jgi:hypothetical protein
MVSATRKSLAAQLWAMRGPSEGYLVYGVCIRGEGLALFYDIREALASLRDATSVQEFWELD